MHACMHAWMYGCKYVCMCVYIHIYIYIWHVYIGLSRLLELRKPEYDWGVGWGGVGC